MEKTLKESPRCCVENAGATQSVFSPDKKEERTAALTGQPAAGGAGPAPTAITQAARHGCENPDSLTRGGRVRAFPWPIRPSPGAPPTAGATANSGDPRGLAGNGRRQPPARPRAPEGQPGALQEHRRGPGEARSRAQGEARGASAGRPRPHRGEGQPLATHSQEAGGEGPLRQETTRPHQLPSGERARERGRAGFRTPPLPHTTTGCKRGEGPADRARRAVPFARNVRPSSGAA